MYRLPLLWQLNKMALTPDGFQLHKTNETQCFLLLCTGVKLGLLVWGRHRV
jgi:hypothetical protein